MKKWLHGIIVCLLGVIVLGGCLDYSQANRHKNAKNFVNQGFICLSDNPSPFR